MIIVEGGIVKLGVVAGKTVGKYEEPVELNVFLYPECVYIAKSY
jgi:hypothetical protein